jgi:uncharacterized protein YwgA
VSATSITATVASSTTQSTRQFLETAVRDARAAHTVTSGPLGQTIYAMHRFGEQTKYWQDHRRDGSMDALTLQTQGRGIAKALRAISARTGHSFTMKSKPGRFVIQKTVYLLRRLRYPSATKYDYNIYLNGPYSPGLAEVYYALEDDGLKSAPAATDDPSRTMDTIATALAGTPDFLEGLTTVIDGIANAKNAAASLTWAKSIKPHLNEATWREVRAFLVKHPELT